MNFLNVDAWQVAELLTEFFAQNLQAEAPEKGFQAMDSGNDTISDLKSHRETFNELFDKVQSCWGALGKGKRSNGSDKGPITQCEHVSPASRHAPRSTVRDDKKISNSSFELEMDLWPYFPAVPSLLHTGHVHSLLTCDYCQRWAALGWAEVPWTRCPREYLLAIDRASLSTFLLNILHSQLRLRFTLCHQLKKLNMCTCQVCLLGFCKNLKGWWISFELCIKR